MKTQPLTKARARQLLEQSREDIAHLLTVRYETDREITRLTRAVVGAYVRGERDTYNPEEVNVICKRAGIRVEKFLAAAGFDVAITPSLDVDPRLAEAWAQLAEPSRTAVLSLAQEAAKAARSVRGSAS